MAYLVDLSLAGWVSFTIVLVTLLYLVILRPLRSKLGIITRSWVFMLNQINPEATKLIVRFRLTWDSDVFISLGSLSLYIS